MFFYKLTTIICAFFGYRVVVYKNGKFKLSSNKIFAWSLMTIYVGIMSFSALRLILKPLTTKLTPSSFVLLLSSTLGYVNSIVSWLSDTILFTDKKVMLHESRLVVQNSLKLNLDYVKSIKLLIAMCLTFFMYSLTQTIADIFTWEQFMMVIISYISSVAVDLMILQFVADNYFNYTRLKAINSKLEKGKMNLMLVIDGYQRLTKNIDCIVTSFALALCLVSLHSILSYVIAINIFVKPSIRNYSKVLSVAFWVGHSLMYMLTISILGEMMYNEEDRLRIIIGKLLIVQNKDNMDTVYQLGLLKKLTDRRGFQISIGGLIPLDFRYLYSIIGITTSYTIIALQMGQTYDPIE